MAADPDGGRDGTLVATQESATLIDGERRTEVRRAGAAAADGGKPLAWNRGPGPREPPTSTARAGTS
ncbi:hypothetical protein [Streptomyces sp. NPDC054842]